MRANYRCFTMQPWGLNYCLSNREIRRESIKNVLENIVLLKVYGKSGIIITLPLVNTMFNYTKAEVQFVVISGATSLHPNGVKTRTCFSSGKKSIWTCLNSIRFASKLKASLNPQVVQITAAWFQWTHCFRALLSNSFLSKPAGFWCKIFTLDVYLQVMIWKIAYSYFRE